MAQPALSEPRGPVPWTEADLDQFPGDSGQHYEIMDGSLLVTPMANDEHQDIADNVRALLKASAPQGWRAIREIGVRVPSGNLIPDVTVLYPHAQRAVTWRDPEDVALVVEVESPSTRRCDRKMKPELYAEAGIPVYWRIEQHIRAVTVLVYELIGRDYKLAGTATAVHPHQVTLPYPVLIDPAQLVG